MKVIIRDGRVVKMSKKISRDEFSGTYIGITTFSLGAQQVFFHTMDNLVIEGRVNEFFDWDNVESDPAREWGQFDEEDKKYVRENYPEDCTEYFSQLKDN